jgi:hypothetical protein
MKLYIQTLDGQTINHPAFENNLMQAFGNIPQDWEEFVRVECPTPTTYQILENNQSTYTKVDGVWTDVWALRDMTVEEKLAKQQSVRDAFNSQEQASNWSAWTLDKSTCTMIPPITRPELDKNKINQGIFILWCGADNNWKDTPAKPEGEYKFDFFAWNWVSI